MKAGQDLKNQAAHPHQEFPGAPSWKNLLSARLHSSENAEGKVVLGLFSDEENQKVRESEGLGLQHFYSSFMKISILTAVLLNLHWECSKQCNFEGFFSYNIYASVNSSCTLHPPGLLRGICPSCQSQGWGICEFCAARGPGICQPGAIPELLTHTQFPIRK